LKSAIRLTYNFIFKSKQRKLTVKIVFYAAVARFRVFFFPGSRLHRYLGEAGVETGTGIHETEQQKKIALVSRRVARVAVRVPWQSKCLVQAMVAQRLLRDYLIESTLYLGVGRDKENNDKMIAHAWLRSGPFYVVGGRGEGYATVAKFRM